MSKEKPSKTEDEYFAREEAEKVKRLKSKLKEQASIDERERIKAVCYMKCPKCGADLHEVVFRGVKIDRCLGCDGVWLDEGELEKLAGTSEKSLIGDILGFFKSTE